MPVYSLPWLFCTGPLTLLLLLVIVARAQSRGFNPDEVEQAAMAAAIKTVAVQNETATLRSSCRFPPLQHGLTGLGCIRMGYGLGRKPHPTSRSNLRLHKQTATASTVEFELVGVSRP